jgi:hypothetical protein
MAVVDPYILKGVSRSANLHMYFTSKKYNKMEKKGEHATQMPHSCLNQS